MYTYKRGVEVSRVGYMKGKGKTRMKGQQGERMAHTPAVARFSQFGMRCPFFGYQ